MAKTSSTKENKHPEADPRLPDLPLASARLKIDPDLPGKFEIPLRKEYDGLRGFKGDDSTPLKNPMSTFDAEGFLDYVRRDTRAADRKRAAEAVRQSAPELYAAFQRSTKADSSTRSDNGLPPVAPKLWEERITGREVSPADFILQHYSPWLGAGLTRAHIGKLDERLYAAYAQQVRRYPDQALSNLPSRSHKATGEAEDILEQRRARDRQRKSIGRTL